jgi:hypothetical protein
MVNEHSYNLCRQNKCYCSISIEVNLIDDANKNAKFPREITLFNVDTMRVSFVRNIIDVYIGIKRSPIAHAFCHVSTSAFDLPVLSSCEH